MSDRESRATKALLLVKRFYVRDIHLPDGSKLVLVSKRPIKCRAHHCARVVVGEVVARKRRRSKHKKKSR